MIGNGRDFNFDVGITLKSILDGYVTSISRHDRVESLAIEVLQALNLAVLGDDEVHEEVVIRLG